MVVLKKGEAYNGLSGARKEKEKKIHKRMLRGDDISHQFPQSTPNAEFLQTWAGQ